MNNNDQKKKTLVADHALKWLHKVEKEQRKPYVKPKHQFSFQNVFMILIFLIVLLVMLMGII